MTAPTPPSKIPLTFCPYCRARGFDDTKLDKWGARSVTTGFATRWTRCEVCGAMWREVYDWENHIYLYKEHWKPRE